MTNMLVRPRENRPHQHCDSLEIHNFRVFRSLKIAKLGNINLIVGKNSVGKSVLMEAVRLYATQGSPKTIGDILQEREEWSPRQYTTEEALDAVVPVNNLFHGRPSITQDNIAIQIGPIGLQNDTLTLEVGWGVYKLDSEGQTSWARLALPAIAEADTFVDDRLDKVEPRLIVQYGNDKSQNLRLDDDKFRSYSRSMVDLSIRPIEPVFAAATGLSIDEMVERWEKVSLIPEAKSSVLGALQIIAPDIENLDITGRRRTARYTPVVMAKLVGIPNPVALRSLGEGMVRVFGLALALVTAQNTMLLIDEIDSGLHHSVQIEIWRLIFGVAEQLNVQVFATTHSWDCVAAFQQIASENTQQNGLLIRLQRDGSDIVPILIDEDTLAIVAREQVEIR